MSENRPTDAWLHTYTGICAEILAPTVDMVCIEDIARSLSNQCRFNGHVREFYSVAQHSVYVSNAVHDGLAIPALLHDAAEAYLGDLIRPIKRHTKAGREFEALEAVWQEVIEYNFHLDGGILEHPLIMAADRRMLMTEKRDIVPAEQPRKWEESGVEPYALQILPWSPREAYAAFVLRWEMLTA